MTFEGDCAALRIIFTVYLYSILSSWGKLFGIKAGTISLTALT